MVWACGKNAHSELGIKGVWYIDSPVGIKGIRKNNIIWISAGKNHTSLIDERNNVFMMGSNLHEKLGLDITNFNNKSRPTLLPLGAN